MRVLGLVRIELVNFEVISFTAGLLVFEDRPIVFWVFTLELVELVDVVDDDDCIPSEWFDDEAYVLVVVVDVSFDVFESVDLAVFSFNCFDLLSWTNFTRYSSIENKKYFII